MPYQSLEERAVTLASEKMKLGVPFKTAVAQAADQTGLLWAEVQHACARRSVAARKARKLQQFNDGGQGRLSFD